MMFSDFIELNRAEIVSSLTSLLQTEHVADKIPYRPVSCNNHLEYALNQVLELAKRKSLKTRRINQHTGIIELGSSENCIGVFCNIDAKPPNSQMLYPPSGEVTSEERLYGQGLLDDKGPPLAIIWALIALKTLDLNMPIKIHVILGSEAESDSAAMEYYGAVHPKPIAGFSVDSEFPIVVSESGCLHLEVSIPKEDQMLSPHVVRFEGGIATNLVPDHAYAVVECLSETSAAEWANSISRLAKQRQLSVDSSLNGSRLQFVVHGLSVDAAEPNCGRNAVVELAQLLSAHSISNSSMWRTVAHMTTIDTTQALQIPEECTFQYSFNLGRAALVSNKYMLQLDIRYPLDWTATMMIDRLQEQFPDKWEIRLIRNFTPVRKSPDTNVCQVLQRVFEQNAGTMSEPLHSRRVSYGRQLENVYGFGSRFPDQRNVDNPSDAHMALNDYFQCIQIYAQAMWELSNTL